MKFKRLKYSYNVLGFSIIIFLAIREIFGVVFNLMGMSINTAGGIGIYMVIFIFACLVPATIMENMLGLRPKIFKKVKSKTTINLVFYSYLIILIAGFVDGIIHKLFNYMGFKFKNPQINIPENKFSMILLFIFMCVLPPILEEIFVRGYVFNAFRCFGQTFAIVVSSLCFALMHSSLDRLLVYFVCGVLLAQLYCITDSIFPSMILHFVNNSIAFFISYFQQRVNPIYALTMIIYINIVVIVLGIVGKIYIDKNNIKITEIMEKDKELAKKLMVISKSYVGLAAFALLLFLAVYQSFCLLV